MNMLGLFSSGRSDAIGRSIAIGGRNVRIQRVLAEGGYAVVFEGHDTATREGFAVKRIIAPDAETQERAEQEITVHARMRHEHILPLLGEAYFKRRDGAIEYFMLMPLCDGGHLWDYASSNPLSLGDKLRVLYEIASAIAYMHSLPLSHHDLKLENVLLDDDGGGRCRCLLCDFGSATSSVVDFGNSPSKEQRLELEDRITRFSTPMYRSPEMCDLYSNLPVGPAADVWALGCVLYVLCFGEHPFAEASTIQIIHGKWATPKGRQCDSSLLALITAMLRADPRERPAASAVAAAAHLLRNSGSAEQTRSAQLAKILRPPSAKLDPSEAKQTEGAVNAGSDDGGSDGGGAKFAGHSPELAPLASANDFPVRFPPITDGFPAGTSLRDNEVVTTRREVVAALAYEASRLRAWESRLLHLQPQSSLEGKHVDVNGKSIPQ